jgi:transposase-like protein
LRGPLAKPGFAKATVVVYATSDERAPLKTLERENRELRQANELLCKVSAYFAQVEFDCCFK